MKTWYLSTLQLPAQTANAMQTMQMCQALRRLGHDVVMVAVRAPRSPDSSGSIDWSVYGVTTPFRIRSERRGASRRGSLAYGLRAALLARRGGCELAFSRHLHTGSWSGGLGIPTVLEWHSLSACASERFWVRWLRRCRGPVLSVFITEALRRDFCSMYPGQISEERMLVASDGVDVQRFWRPDLREDMRARLGIAPSTFVAGYVGHFYTGRGIREIVLPLAGRLTDVTFLLVGGTPEDHAPLSAELRRRQLSNVRLVPFVPNTDVPAYLGACDALLAPYQRRISVSGGEGDTSKWTSPLKLFEYMASGRPMIVSALPVFREVLNESTCTFCEPDSVESWELALRRLRDDPCAAAAQAATARRVASQYAWEGRAARCIAAMSRLTGSAALGRGKSRRQRQ